MISNISFFVISLLVSSATWYLYAMLRASGLREQRMKGFNALCICLPFWVLLNAIITLVKPELFLAFYILKSIPLEIIPYLSCWFFLHFAESKAADSRAIMYFSIAMPSLSMGMILTNPWHGLYLLSFDNPPVVGPLFLAHLAVSLTYILIVYCILFRYIIKNYRDNPLLIVGGIGTVIPIVVYAFYLFLPDVLRYDITPIGYFFTIIFVAYASYAKRMQKNKPGLLGETLAKIAISQELSTGTIEDTARLIVKESCLALDAYRVGVWLYDENTQVIKNIACFDSNTKEHSVNDDIDLHNYPKYKKLIETCRINVINDRREFNPDMDILADYDPDICSMSEAPIRIGGKLAGVICAEQNQCMAFPIKREWSLEEQSFTSSLADLMALAIINTERLTLIRQLEEEQKVLYDSEERVHLLLDSAPFSVNLIDKNFRCVFVNEAAVRLYDLSNKQEYLDLFSSGTLSKERGIEHIKKAHQDGYCRCKMTFQKPNGEELPCELTLVRVMYRNDYAIAAYARDLRMEISAAEKIQKVEEEKFTIEQAHQQLQTIFDLMPIGIVIMEKKDGTMLYANNTARNIYNIGSGGKDGEGYSVFDFLPEYQPDNRKSVDVLAELSALGKGVVETQNVKITGETFWTRTSFCYINYNGTAATLNVIEDMTAEHEHKQRLYEIVFKEQEANQLKSRFLARMSHEIRTPMNAIIGMTDLALREDEPDIMKEYINTVKQAGVNLLDIINDILDFSKIEAGKMEIREDNYSVAALLNDVVSIIRISAAGSNLRFAVKADSKIPNTLYGDETRIRQAVLNLLNNAVKYTEKGYVLLSIYGKFTGEDTIEITIEVTDTGIGIIEEDIDKLFTDFTQLDLDRRSIEGIGLGLAITHSIVSAMGGNITVKSEYGKGSTFTITVPQKFNSREELAAIENPGDKTVLIFEQREVYTDSLAYSMDNLGVPYTCVSNGTALYNEMEKRIYDYLFISSVLYIKNEDTLKKLGKDTKIVIITEFSETVPVTFAEPRSGEGSPPKKNLSSLVMPIYCTGIANALNTAYDEPVSSPSNQSLNYFSAPDAKVLVVDDINTNLKVAEGLLKPYNMRVDLCNSGKSAIEAVKTEHYDIVFMDHKMPGMDGVEATKNIREMGYISPYFTEVPIIALTANAVSGMKEMFIENGFNDFLSKPIDTMELHSILEKWVVKAKR